MSSVRFGPGGEWCFNEEETLPRLYREKGYDIARLAYATDIDTSRVRRVIGKRASKEREQAAQEEIARTAWNLVVEKCVNFYDARDRIKVHAEDLVLELRRQFLSKELQDSSSELQRESARAYAIKVYRKTKMDLWETAHALEMKSRRAKVILDDAYDPYADWRDEADAVAQIKSMAEAGKSLSQIEWAMRARNMDVRSVLKEHVYDSKLRTLAMEMRERYQNGETLDSLSMDTGVPEYKIQSFLTGLFEHPLDLYGMDRLKREQVGSLYLNDGYEPDEIAVLTGFAESWVRDCIDDFFYREVDESRHKESYQDRWSKEDAHRITAPVVVVDEEERARKRRQKSLEDAQRIGLNIERAAPFLEDGLVPTRAELYKKKDARERLSRAMFDQGKSVEDICEVVGVAAKTVESYLGDLLAARTKEELEKSESVKPTEMAAALYSSGRTSARFTYSSASLTGYLMWKWPLANWYIAPACELRWLIASEGIDVVTASALLGIGLSKAKRLLGSFGSEPAGGLGLSQRMMSVYLSDALNLSDEDIAELLGTDKRSIREANNDGRELPDWMSRRWYGWDQVEAKRAAEAIGVPETIVRQAARTGILKEPSWYGNYTSDSHCDSCKIVEALGLIGAHPLPCLENGDEDGD